MGGRPGRLESPGVARSSSSTAVAAPPRNMAAGYPPFNEQVPYATFGPPGNSAGYPWDPRGGFHGANPQFQGSVAGFDGRPVGQGFQFGHNCGGPGFQSARASGSVSSDIGGAIGVRPAIHVNPRMVGAGGGMDVQTSDSSSSAQMQPRSAEASGSANSDALGSGMDRSHQAVVVESGPAKVVMCYRCNVEGHTVKECKAILLQYVW